jgi:hypothetical protein
MPPQPLTFASAERVPLHWSLFWDGLCHRAGGHGALTNWLIAQANARGFLGAIVDQTAARAPVDGSLALEDLMVGLLMPHAELDARIVKLVVRMLQSGQFDGAKLAFRARRERADVALAWVLSLVPPEEQNESLAAVSRALRPPRGFAQVNFNYDPQRLVRRPATKDHLWRAKQR